MSVQPNRVQSGAARNPRQRCENAGKGWLAPSAQAARGVSLVEFCDLHKDSDCSTVNRPRREYAGNTASPACQFAADGVFNDFLFIFKGLCLSNATFREQENNRESSVAGGVPARPGDERGAAQGGRAMLAWRLCSHVSRLGKMSRVTSRGERAADES